MKTDKIKIAIFPLGSAMKFRKENIKRSDGTSEYFKLFYGLARNASVSEIWIMQRSDWRKLTSDEKIAVDPRGVIRDIYTEFEVNVSPGRRQGPTGELIPHTKDEQQRYKDLWNKIQHLEQPDFGIGFATQGLTMVNIPGIVPGIKDPAKMTGALDMTLIYSAPLIHWLNMSKLPWFLILTDPRYVKMKQKWRDMVNGPKESIAQYNMAITLTHFNKYPDLTSGTEVEDNIYLKYSGIEKLNLIGEQVIPPDNEDRDIKFTIVAMQSAYGFQGVDYRLDCLKKWILNFKDTQDFYIYGKWDERFTKGHSQFQGYRIPEEIDGLFKRTKYTLVIPIRPNWVTSKYAEMLRVGVVPFLHPDYDTQYSLLPKDHYIRVKTPKEMYDKVAELEANPEKRIKLVKELQFKFLQGVRKGTFLGSVINPFLERAGVPVHLGLEYSDEVLRVPELADFNSAGPRKVEVKAKPLF